MTIAQKLEAKGRKEGHKEGREEEANFFINVLKDLGHDEKTIKEILCRKEKLSREKADLVLAESY